MKLKSQRNDVCRVQEDIILLQEKRKKSRCRKIMNLWDIRLDHNLLIRNQQMLKIDDDFYIRF